MSDKQYEYLVTTFDPVYNDMTAAIEIVKQFIIDNGCIVYGGTAIDYALRLKGDQIYPDDMLKVPDLDFYSPDSVNLAYKLADILYDAGYLEARAICALHIETMRVDLKENHWIADISYRPKDVFEKIPYLTYNGMRIVHPQYQRIDLHSALSFPYDNPPKEVIFDRWAKDVKRFNKIDILYPVEATPSLRETVHTVPRLKGMILAGECAYAVIMSTLGTAHAPQFKLAGDFMTFSAIGASCDYVYNGDLSTLNEVTSVRLYEPYSNLLPARLEGTHTVDNVSTKVTIHSTKNKLLSVNSVLVGDAHLRVVCAQYLLKYFLAMYYMRSDNRYLHKYATLLAAIKDGGSPLLALSTNYYGSENINLAMEVLLSRLHTNLYGSPSVIIPTNYYPARARPLGKSAPSFNVNTVPLFRESGEEITPQTTPPMNP